MWQSKLKLFGAIVAALGLTLALTVPSFTQVIGQGAALAFDTITGGLKVYVVTLLGGEHLDSAEENGYLRVSGAAVRSFALQTNVTTNVSGVAVDVPSGGKTPIAWITGTGAVSATVTYYCDYTSTVTEEFPVGTPLSLTGTTEDAKKDTQFTLDCPYYHSKVTAISGTSATVQTRIFQGINGSGSGGGGGDATAANQGTMITSLQAIDNDQNGGGVHYRTSAGATEDEHEIKATGGRLFSIVVTNTNAAARYLRCSNLTAANTTPGTSTVFLGLAIPGSTTGAGFQVNFAGSKGVAFSTALTCWFVTGAADTDVAEVAANEIKAIYTFE